MMHRLAIFLTLTVWQSFLVNEAEARLPERNSFRLNDRITEFVANGVPHQLDVSRRVIRFKDIGELNGLKLMTCWSSDVRRDEPPIFKNCCSFVNRETGKWVVRCTFFPHFM